MYLAVRPTPAAEFSRQSVGSLEVHKCCIRQRVRGDTAASDIMQ